jgi:hypothetical protein
MKIRRILRYTRIAMLAGAFAFTAQPGTPPIKVRNATQAMNSALSYLRQQRADNVPDEDIGWQERTLYATGVEDYAITSRLFTSDDWLIEVFQGVAPLSRTVYRVTVFSPKYRWYWQGSIKPDGSVTEAIALKLLPEEECHQISEEFVRKCQVPRPRAGGYGH